MATKKTRIYRIREPYALLHPDHGIHVVPTPDQEYAEDDPLVEAYPWAFQSDDDRDFQPAETVESVPVEQATQAPGEKRRTRRS